MKSEDSRPRPALASARLGLALVGMIGILTGCYPYDRDSAEDYDLVVTFFDPTADFAGKTTYAMPDEIVEVADPNLPPLETDRINSTVETAILAAIEDNMQALGYTRLPNIGGTAPSGADVHITPFAVKTTWSGGSCYPYYYDWWYGGSGWCYPVYYSYTTGTVFIPMFDSLQPEGSKPLWIAAINGIINLDPPSAVAERARNAVNSAYNQSPYLRTQ